MTWDQQIRQTLKDTISYDELSCKVGGGKSNLNKISIPLNFELFQLWFYR